MSSRNKIVIETPESNALNELRQKRGISLQKLANALTVSKQLVHIIETGRANISEDYITKFLKVLNYNLTDFEALVNKKAQIKGPNLRQQCHDRLDEIDYSKLEHVLYLLHKVNGR